MLNLILYAALLGFVSLGVMTTFSWLQSHEAIQAVGGVVAILGTLFMLFSIRRSNEYKKNLVLLLGTLAVMSWLADLALAFLQQDPRIKIARDMGKTFDARSKLEVVLECRSKGDRCYPNIYPNILMSEPLLFNGRRVQPLSTVADAKIVTCNEEGEYMTYRSDEYGLRNPPYAWRNTAVTDVVLLGDSFAHGQCVSDQEDIAARLRQRLPHVLNLASGGNGPLLELASLREFMVGRKARHLIWLYYEGNDLEDLERDKKDTLLMRYLEPGYSQNILAHRQEINQALTDFVEKKMTKQLESRPIVLPHLRNALWILRHKGNEVQNAQQEFDLPLLRRVLAQAKADTDALGGRMMFVYLPEYQRFADVTRISSGAAHKQAVLDMARSLGLNVIDIEPAMRLTPDPLALFPYRLHGHYNAQGYALVADEILRHIEPPLGMPAQMRQ